LSLYFKIATFYEFKTLNNLNEFSNLLKDFCKNKKILGSIILAPEGINGTIAGLPDSINEFVNYMEKLKFENLNIKYSKTSKMPFYRNKIKIKKEIVTFLNEPINPEQEKAKYVSPKNWNKIINDPDVIIIDVRNDYETKIGTFKNAISPNTESFVDFKKFISEKLNQNKNKKIAMFCTGGIRCEKASYYMKEIGFKNIFQLEGGILKYIEVTPEIESLWNGECFVFDKRVTVTAQLEKGNYDLCHGCNKPISKKDQKSTKFEKDVSCPYCYDNATEDKKAKSRERSKQIALAKKRKTPNVYLPTSIEDY
tara:strand:+ start:37484 stop:38413 length:930 start_codon:yes stop_codon:yes gene_type:complete